MKAMICQAAFWGQFVLARSVCFADCAVLMGNGEEPSVYVMTAVPDLTDEGTANLAFFDASVFSFLPSKGGAQLFCAWLPVSGLCQMLRGIPRLCHRYFHVGLFHNITLVHLWRLPAANACGLGLAGGRNTAIDKLQEVAYRDALWYRIPWFISCLYHDGALITVAI